ncbi:Beta-ketoacyl synthase, C-terminal domain [Methylomagnum ishizawai]|uniref:Beta-ketoacyl synthase, C-terminal domain n=1 Tax=Methylomagnum ishizawai TaxID=1760988 RepID=A0A1Y6D4B3_9GAMM|nr:polyketide synthase [Methylomagnum ishizawai]SMF97497.1 Beta-ketoacyl synthase, C-terminal domain [Methylomagnum ishizawai]
MPRMFSERYSPDQADNSIAIIGTACRLPGAENIDALWRLLAEGRSALQAIPAGRWDIGHLYHPERKTPGRTVNRQAGLIDGIDRFDAAFFGLSAREARSLDPQQRLLLETTWHALEDAGLAPEPLRGQRVGVYAAAMANDYQQHTASPFHAPDAYAATGTYAALLANRLSGFFGWRGESVTVDTACASSLAALHHARLALLSGAVDYCVVGAVNALISPWRAVAFSQAGMLSGDGLCKTFAEGADGYVPGEGVVVLILRRTPDALAAGDRIHGLLLGTALNHMGPAPTLTAPSVEAEAGVIAAALRQAGVDPTRLSYVECHGTGTALGDPIEVEALARALPAGPAPVLLGSIKTNIGHLEAAAGLAGVLKVLLMLRHGQIPPTLNLAQDNPLIDFAALSLAPARRLTAWDSRPRLAGVSAFGFGGAGGHAILAEPPARYSPGAGKRPVSTQSVPLPLSAADPTALRDLASALAEHLEQPNPPDLDTLNRGLSLQRGALPWRLLIRARDLREAVAGLRRAESAIQAPMEITPDIALRLWSGPEPAAWQESRRQIPGLERIALDLERQLTRAGFHPADTAVAAHLQIRAWLDLLAECGVEPRLFHAFGGARPAALAAAGVLDDIAAARLACHGRVEPTDCRRPVVAYRDGDTGLELPPLRPAAAALQALQPTVAATRELLDLGQRLWRSNHTFRAQLETWQDVLGTGLGERLTGESTPGLALAVATALWSTCARWSLRPPTVAVRWAAWPVAGWVADGWVGRNLALDVLGQARPFTELAAPLARITRSPDAERHPWLAQQRAHLPEWADLSSPLEGPSRPPVAEAADWVIALGSRSTAPALPTPGGRLLWLDPADGLAGLEEVLAELWHHGCDVRYRALGWPRPHIPLPRYPFNRQSYWLPRLPENASPTLWETGQTFGAEAATAPPAVPADPAPPKPGIGWPAYGLVPPTPWKPISMGSIPTGP